MELMPGRTVTLQPDSSGRSFFAPLKKPVSPERTTVKVRHSGCARTAEAMFAGLLPGTRDGVQHALRADETVRFLNCLADGGELKALAAGTDAGKEDLRG